METGARTILKAVLWNLLGLLTMTVVGLVATGSAVAGCAMAIANTAIGFTLYLVYERVWARVRWGYRG